MVIEALLLALPLDAYCWKSHQSLQPHGSLCKWIGNIPDVATSRPESTLVALVELPLHAVIYLDWHLFGAAGWRLFALAVDPPILQPAWRGFEAVERLERRIYTQFKERLRRKE